MHRRLKSNALLIATYQVSFRLPFATELVVSAVCNAICLLVMNAPICSQYVDALAPRECLTAAGAAGAALFVGPGGAQPDCQGLRQCWTGIAVTQLSLSFFVPLASIFLVERAARLRFLRSLVPGMPVELADGQRAPAALIILQAGWLVYIVAHALVFGRL